MKEEEDYHKSLLEFTGEDFQHVLKEDLNHFFTF